MLQGRYNPIPTQAEITGKGQPDLFSFRQRADTQGLNAFPGGSVETNLWIVPGELLVTRRNARNTTGGYGRTFQTVYSSLNGVVVEDNNLEAAMREVCFAGFAKSEYEYGGESLFGTDPLDHGFGFIYHGSITTINTGSGDLYAFDKLCFRIPSLPNGDPRSQGTNAGRVIDNGLNPLNSNTTRRLGVPQGKILFQLERYDPTDFSMQTAGCFELFNKPKINGGVKNVTLREWFDKSRKLTPLQEEAFAYSRGLLMIASMGSNDPEATARNWGLFGPELTAEGQEKLGEIFGRNVFPGRNGANAGGEFPTSYAGDEFAYTKDHVFDLLLGGLYGSIHAKEERICGMALSSAKVNQSIDIMVLRK
jgi:hypothetical protein